jgi:hypothetical protein
MRETPMAVEANRERTLRAAIGLLETDVLLLQSLRQRYEYRRLIGSERLAGLRLHLILERAELSSTRVGV